MTESVLKLKFEGPSVYEGRILWEDLSLFVSNVDSAIQRIINVLETGTGIRMGRPPKALKALSALDIVAISKGSFKLGLSLRREQELLPGLDIGEQALIELSDGIKRITQDGEEALLPKGFDQGVLTALREAGHILDRGVERVKMSVNGRHAVRRVKYDGITREHIISKIRQLEQTWATAEGRLLMADVKEEVWRCRLHPSAESPISCRFEQEMTSSIVANLGRFVQVRGDASIDPITNRIDSLFIRDLEPIATPSPTPISIPAPSRFWQPKTFSELAEEQEVYPVDNWEQLIGGWPEDTDFNSFLEAIKSARTTDNDNPRQID